MSLDSLTVRIHQVPCIVLHFGCGWQVMRTDTGAKVSRAPQQLLAIARAAVVLHTPHHVRVVERDRKVVARAVS